MAAAMARGKVAITGSSGILGSRLYAALQANGWDVVGLGLADGVSPNVTNPIGQTALHIATLWGNASAVEALVQAGAAVDQVNDLGAQTPLHLLASRVGKQSNTANRILCAKTLIKAGCDLGKKNEDGVMAYQYLNGEEGDDVVELRKLITPF